MPSWEIKFHPEFLKDLDHLGTSQLEIFYKKKEKIRQNPLRQEHLSGGSNCYREPITDNIRLVYYVEKNTVWLLTIGRHEDAYKEYLKRLYSLRMRME